MLKNLLKTSLLFILIVALGSNFSACKHDPIIPDNTIDTTGTDTTDTDTTNTDTTNTDTTNTDTTTVQQPHCDPDSVYFEQTILPIFAANCATSGCHDAISHEEGVVLDNYAHIYDEIDPYDLDNNVFKAIIDDSDNNRMPPPPYQRLTYDQTLAIAQWILQGAPNNSCVEPVVVCETSNMSYANDILPVLQSYCIGCHTGANAGGGVVLNTYAGVKASADNGALLGSIQHNPDYSPMPKTLPQLDSCTIAQIASWIQAGALNN